MRAARGAVLAALLLAACRVQMPFAERVFFGDRAVPRAADCERCHQEVYREWEGSLHARAWTSEAFRRASAERRAEECLGCHAAAPVGDAPIALRAEHREEGVTCTTCHLSPRPDAAPLTMRGPVARSSPVEVHPVIEKDPLYLSSELCGSCHRDALAEWRAAREARPQDPETCQGCHMPEVRRTVESVHDEHAYSRVFVALEKSADLRRHLFAVPEDVSEHVALEAGRTPEGLRVTVRNRLPHALPTGRFGRRALSLLVEWPGGRSETTWNVALGEAIPSDGSRDLALALPPQARSGSLAVLLRRFDHRLGDWSLLARSDLP